MSDCMTFPDSVEEFMENYKVVDTDGIYMSKGAELVPIFRMRQWFEHLPSAQPERKKGKWIPVTNGRGGFECDRCHCYAPSYQDGVEWLSAFCPNCGCDMRGMEND